MPELPELEVVRDVLVRRVQGRTIARVQVAPRGGPIVVRDLTSLGIVEQVARSTILSITRRGKYLLFDLQQAGPSPSSLVLAVNPKLTGRLQLCPPDARKAGPVHLTLAFDDPRLDLRYVDSKTMGQVYLTRDLGLIPTFDEMGPDALDAGPQEFRDRLRPFRGEIKGILTRAAFVAGIGNAYADEILWEAKLHPYRKRTSLSAEEIDRLYRAMQDVLRSAIETVQREMGEDIHLKPRDFFSVHMRDGQACPRCGTPISSVTANQRITNFCRTCQPGGLIRGMGSPEPPVAGRR